MSGEWLQREFRFDFKGLEVDDKTQKKGGKRGPQRRPKKSLTMLKARWQRCKTEEAGGVTLTQQKNANHRHQKMTYYVKVSDGGVTRREKKAELATDRGTTSHLNAGMGRGVPQDSKQIRLSKRPMRGD